MRSYITCTGYTDPCDGGNLEPRAREGRQPEGLHSLLLPKIKQN